MTDTELIDWLEKKDGFALVSDDAGRWAVSGDGMQNVPDKDKPIDIVTSIFIEAGDWCPDIRSAIKRAQEAE